jgi:cytochrome b
MASMPDPSAVNSPPPQAVRIWDLPTRLFHWSLAACVIGLVITGNVGGNAMVWHFRFGYAVLALLLFRIIWGFAGGRWSRFASFIRGPGTVLRYLRGQTGPGEFLDVGHNPLGALSVIGMLAVLLLQLACGLVADDEIANVGPLNRFVSSDLAQTATSWHKGPGKLLVLVLVVLHVAAIIYYRVRKRQDLIKPMLHGDKALSADVPPSRDDSTTRIAALLVLAGCGAVAATVALLTP